MPGVRVAGSALASEQSFGAARQPLRKALPTCAALHAASSSASASAAPTRIS